jgi:putative salt-induced outer membrane protein YdiY
VRLASLTLFAILLVPAPAVAQAAAPPPPPPKQEGTAELAFVGTTGNASTNTFSIAGEHIARPAPWTIKNRVAFVRNEAEDVLTAKSLLYGFRAERSINARLSAFGEYAYFQDEFAGVDHRNGVTGGLTFKVVDTAVHKFSVDAGLGYLNEQRLSGDDVSSATYGFGSSYKWTISPTATLEDDTRFTGTFDNADDWRFINIVSLTTRLTQILSLKVSNAVRYAHFPPPGFKTTDTTTSIALVAKFAKQ